MTPLSDLLARVEKATGPDRELDARIYVAVIARLKNPAIERMIAERAAEKPHGNVWLDGARDWQVPRYTASLDSALALVERVLPGWMRQISLGGGSFAVLAPLWWREDHGQVAEDVGGFEAHAKTPALALLAALLKALIAREEGK